MGMFLDYCLYISVIGCALLVFLSFCCFFNMEALHLPKGKKNQRGFETFASALIYAGIIAFVLYKKQQKEAKMNRNPFGYENAPDEDLQQRLIYKN